MLILYFDAASMLAHVHVIKARKGLRDCPPKILRDPTYLILWIVMQDFFGVFYTLYLGWPLGFFCNFLGPFSRRPPAQDYNVLRANNGEPYSQNPGILLFR